MPFINTKDGVSIHYEEYGKSTGNEATIVFSHGFMMSLHMFDEQIKALKDSYRIIAFDHRCHGKSTNVKTRFGIYNLVDDAIAVIESLAGGQPVHFMGMSTGGYVALRLMLKRPDLLKSVVLIDTDGEKAYFRKKLELYLLLFVLYWFGLTNFLISQGFKSLIGDPFRNNPSNSVQLDALRNYIASLDNVALYCFAVALFGRDLLLDRLARIEWKSHPLPCLVVVGDVDRATPPEMSERLHQALPHSSLVKIPNAGHTSPIEEPAAVTSAIQNFLSVLKKKGN